MFAARRLTSKALATPTYRSFQSTSQAWVQAGDSLPDVDLVEGSPGNKVNLAKEFKGKGVVIGVPAAFSPSCSAKHIPGYLSSPKLKSAGEVFVVSVNDPFVMKAWGEMMDPGSKSGIRFLGDPNGDFTTKLDLAFDATAIFGQPRSKRYALRIENGKVKEAYVEPDNTGVDVSTADRVLQ